MKMIMHAVRKNIGHAKPVLALFEYAEDAYNYIEERMIENIPSDVLFGRSKTLEIENEYYIELMEVKIGEE